MGARGSPLLFLHVPKAAGTAVRERVASEYSPAELRLVYKGELRLAGPDRATVARWARERDSLEVVFGHFSFGAHSFLDVPPRYAVILRQPVPRVVSLFGHLQGHDDSELAQRVRREAWSLRDFVESGVTEQTNNHMCRMLAGIPARAGERIDDAESLSRALDHVRNHFEFVGFVESLDASMADLARRLGWRSGAVRRVNASPAPPLELDEATRRAIEAANRLDLELYRTLRSAA
jgi:hypothetical protein